MKAFLEIVKFDAADVVTLSYDPASCTELDLPLD